MRVNHIFSSSQIGGVGISAYCVSRGSHLNYLNKARQFCNTIEYLLKLCIVLIIYLADLGKATGCSTNTVSLSNELTYVSE